MFPAMLFLTEKPSVSRELRDNHIATISVPRDPNRQNNSKEQDTELQAPQKDATEAQLGTLSVGVAVALSGA